MKKIIHILTLIIFLLTSCRNAEPGNNEKKGIPKALEDKSSSAEIFSKRGYDDLVESLYQELVDKTPTLKNLETRIAVLQESQSDSTRLFTGYHQKSQSYFGAADSHILQIKDSVLRERVKALLTVSLEKYNSSIIRHTGLLNSINDKTSSLNDLHIVLKIVKTLPLMEKYQSDNRPSTQPLEGFLNEVDKAIKIADTIAKKPAP